MADWEALKTEYITGDISYRKLADKHGVSFNTLSVIAKKENWRELRRKIHEKATTKIIEKASQDRANKLSGILKAADGLSELISRTVDKINNLDQQMEDSPIDCKMIKDLTTATRDLTSVIRDLYDIPTEGERHARQIASERLEIEKRRAAVEEKNTEITVRFGDGEGHEEWAR